MTYKIAAAGEHEAYETEVGLLTWLSRRPVELPGGTLHAYLVDHATATYCGLPTASLVLFPNIDWPGGYGLSNAHCPRCGEATADQ